MTTCSPVATIACSKAADGGDQLIGQIGGSDTASYQHAASGVEVHLAVLSGTKTPGRPKAIPSPTFPTCWALASTTSWSATATTTCSTDSAPRARRSDVLTGAGGADTFVFGGGRVTVTDFEADIDKIDLSFLNFGGGLTEQDLTDLLDAAQGSDTLDFGNGQTLTLANVVDVSALQHSDFILQH